MSKIDIIIELYNIIHSSSNDDIVALLKDILNLAAHEHVLDSSSVKGLLSSMYDDIISDDGIVSYVMNEYNVEDIFSPDEIKDSATSTNTLAELAEDYSNDDVISFIENYMNDNAYEMLHWMSNDSIMAYVKHHIKINDYLSADLED